MQVASNLHFQLLVSALSVQGQAAQGVPPGDKPASSLRTFSDLRMGFPGPANSTYGDLAGRVLGTLRD
jgi:hypothetical protein